MNPSRWYMDVDRRIRWWAKRVHDLVGWPFQVVLFSPTGRWIRRNTEPNHWTLLRFPMAILLAILLYLRQDAYAIGLYVLSVLTDRFDGEFARLDHKSTPFGTLLDTVADAVMQSAVLLSLIGRYPPILSNHTAWRLPLVVVILEVLRLIGGLILRSIPKFAAHTKALEPNMSGKFKMAALAFSVLAILSGAVTVAQQSLLIAICLSAYSMLRHLYDVSSAPR